MRLTVSEARKRLKWSPEDLAEHAGVHRATVYRIEAGDISNPSYDTVQALELALKVKPGTLVFGSASVARTA